MTVYLKSRQTQRQNMEKRKFLLEGDCFRFAIGCVPNVMCSSLRAAVAEIECGNNTRYQIVDGVPRCADGISRCAKSGESEHRSFVRRSRHLVFGRPHHLVFLRDPFERLFSSFRRHKALFLAGPFFEALLPRPEIFRIRIVDFIQCVHAYMALEVFFQSSVNPHGFVLIRGP